MAKGRKLTTSRSERLLGGYSYGHSQGTADDTSELGEEDVWAVVNGSDDLSVNVMRDEWSPRASGESNGGSIMRRRHDERHVGGLSLAFNDPCQTASPRIVHQFRNQDSVASPRERHVAASAPVNVPDWSKIYRVKSVESCNDSDDGTCDPGSEIIPPHEYLAREYRNTAAHSVFEGVGRTLKGRDLSRVRDAVWSQTGFDG